MMTFLLWRTGIRACELLCALRFFFSSPFVCFSSSTLFSSCSCLNGLASCLRTCISDADSVGCVVETMHGLFVCILSLFAGAAIPVSFSFDLLR